MGVIRHIVVKGRVQGVGYRAWLADRAIAHGLDGWVRNRSYGAVEAVLSGETETVAAMMEECRQGPSTARVEKIEETAGISDDLKLRRAGERFSVLPTI